MSRATQPSVPAAPRRMSYTRVLLGTVVIVAVLSIVIMSLPFFDEHTELVLADTIPALASALFTVIVLRTALRISRGRVRTQWLLVAASLAAYTAGDITWAYLELVRGLDPFPSVADFWYFSQYALLGLALVLVALSFRGIVPFARPLALASAISAFALALIYFGVLAPYILPAGPDELTTLGKAVSVAYPAADVLVLLLPATLVVFLALGFGGGRLAQPWILVAAGALVLAATDSAWVYADWAGLYESWAWAIGSGYVISNACVAAAAVVAREAYKI